MGNVNTLIFLVILIVAVGITTLSIFKGKNILGKNVVEGLASANVTDTPGWTNNYDKTCDDYSGVWCSAGAAVKGQEWALGKTYNNPENNCIVCGKGKVKDTLGWTNMYKKTCQDYSGVWCSGGNAVKG